MELAVLEKKWNIRLLAHLHGKEPQRFKELLKICDRDATLSARLKELERHGLIEAIPVKAHSQKFFAYQLKPEGNRVANLLAQIAKK